MSVDVIDSNDNPPIFTVSHYSFQIYEVILNLIFFYYAPIPISVAAQLTIIYF